MRRKFLLVLNILKPTRRRVINLVVTCLLVFAVLVAVRLYPHPPLWQNVPLSTAVYDDSGHLLRLTLAKDDRYRLWLPLEDFSPELLEAVQTHEDNWFYYHPGFNPLSLLRGGWRTYVSAEPRQGGSTLTMQLARLRWKLNTRDLPGKAVQIMRAIQLELCYSKDEILEAYLNLAPFGRNIEGAGTASLIYFSKQPKDLTLPESLTLAVLPQAPNKRITSSLANPSKPDEMSISLFNARNRLYVKWLEAHPNHADQATLFNLPLNIATPEHLPFKAPHFVEQVLRKYKFNVENTPIINTTLNLPMQILIERRLDMFLKTGESKGISNAAVLLLDTRDMEIKALVGSGSYYNHEISGQINGTAIKRSPGSTLKPFIYALAIDQGLIHPRTVLKDVPTSFSSYSPENFDSRFLGPVTATEALVRSRNIPAVYVANQLSKPSFYQFLRSAGVNNMASEGHYGLALVLGGGEVTMQEVARLYAILANDGMLKPLRFEQNTAQPEGIRLLSKESSFITMDMLAQNPRPDDALLAQPTTLPIYWKTGTSWGFRDAWSAGIFGHYVLVVWVGNFDNSGNQAFVGNSCAAPLFFGIIDALKAEYPELKEETRPIPENITRLDVCLASGNLPTVWCPRLGQTWFIPGKSPITVDTVHRPIYFYKGTEDPACPPYDLATTEPRVYEFWSSDLLQTFAKAGLPKIAPPKQPLCTEHSPLSIGQKPSITSPLKGKTYTLQARRTAPQHIALSATTDADVENIYWFVNDAFLTKTNAGQIFYWEPESPGTYTLRVVDDHARSALRNINVDFVN